MVEYLFDLIRATAGEQMTIAIESTETLEEPYMVIGDAKANGTYTDGKYQFYFTADQTVGKKGMEFYQVYDKYNSLCFKCPVVFEEGLK